MYIKKKIKHKELGFLRSDSKSKSSIKTWPLMGIKITAISHKCRVHERRGQQDEDMMIEEEEEKNLMPMEEARSMMGIMSDT